MRHIETCLSPDLIHLHDLADRTVVIIDILRATSCFTAGIASGVEHIVAKATPEECIQLRKQGYLTAGERNGMKIEGFDLGNSPFEYMKAGGKKIAATTTNGTKAIVATKDSNNVLIGSFLNISTIGEYIREQTNDLLLVCSGWKGRFSMEDALFAGALVDILYEDFMLTDDASIACHSLFLSAKNDMLLFLKNCSHFNRLKGYGLHEDLQFCMTRDKFNVLPVVVGGIITKG